jgi:hypothetical protein
LTYPGDGGSSPETIATEVDRTSQSHPSIAVGVRFPADTAPRTSMRASIVDSFRIARP